MARSTAQGTAIVLAAATALTLSGYAAYKFGYKKQPLPSFQVRFKPALSCPSGGWQAAHAVRG
jgi:hypothetical protein